jgi:hypothetical protein
MPKLPYKFSYRFKDDVSVESKLRIGKSVSFIGTALKGTEKTRLWTKSGKNIWTTLSKRKTSTFS